MVSPRARRWWPGPGAGKQQPLIYGNEPGEPVPAASPDDADHTG